MPPEHSSPFESPFDSSSSLPSYTCSSPPSFISSNPPSFASSNATITNLLDTAPENPTVTVNETQNVTPESSSAEAVHTPCIPPEPCKRCQGCRWPSKRLTSKPQEHPSPPLLQPTSSGLFLPIDTHPAADISALLVIHLRDPTHKSHPLRMAALHRWEALLPDLQRPTEDLAVITPKLDEIFHIFDDIFFFGALSTGHVRARWSRTAFWHGHCPQGRGATRTGPQGKKISLRPPESMRKKYSWIDSVQSVLEVLLKQMCHAVFQRFACRCEKCRCFAFRKDSGQGVIGFGPVSQNLRKAVEDEADLWLKGLLEGGSCWVLGKEEEEGKHVKYWSWWEERREGKLGLVAKAWDAYYFGPEPLFGMR